MDALQLDVACQSAFRLVDATNEYIAASAPWALAKAGQDDALDRVLWNASEGLRVAAVLLSPVMPASCRTILARLGTPVADVGDLRLERDAQVHVSGTRQLTRADALWPRLEADAAAAPISTKTKETPVSDAPKDVATTPTVPAAPAASPAAARVPAPPPAAAPVEGTDTRLSIDEFMKVDLRVAQVLTAERVPKSKKLVKLSVDLGSETRTIVAGIGEAYEPEALVGRRIAIVANLKPAKLMGIESNGMVLAASAEGNRPILIDFAEPPASGTRIR